MKKKILVEDVVSHGVTELMLATRASPFNALLSRKAEGVGGTRLCKHV